MIDICLPAKLFPGAAGPPCETCVMILAGPPVAAITYVNESRGLDPSVYGGGGSDSSALLLEDSAFVSRGRAALVSASTLEVAGAVSGGGVGAGEKAGGGPESGSRTFRRSGEACDGK